MAPRPARSSSSPRTGTPESTPHFAKDGGIWPVHCVADTWGAELHPDLDRPATRRGSARARTARTATRGFTMRDPVDRRDDADRARGLLRDRGIEQVVVCGLATDYCVNATALDASAPRLRDVRPATRSRPVDLEPGDGERALEAMTATRASRAVADPDALSRRRSCRSTSSTRPTSCSAPTTRRGRRSSAATASSCPASPGCATSCSTCSARRARRTSAARPTASSSRSATTCSRATSRRPACRRELLAQFPIAEEAIEALGIVLWPMVEFEADDAIAAAAGRFAADPAVEQILICTPDKDMAQCVDDDRVVLRDRRRRITYDEAGVMREVGRRAGVDPGLARARRRLRRTASRACPGWGAKSAAAVLRALRLARGRSRPRRQRWDVPSLARRGALAATLREQRDEALLYRDPGPAPDRRRRRRSRSSVADELRWRGAPRATGRRSATHGAWTGSGSRPHRWLAEALTRRRGRGRAGQRGQAGRARAARGVVGRPARRATPMRRGLRARSNHGAAVERR